MISNATVEGRLARIYGDAHGYVETDAEAARVERSGSSSTYGELTVAGTAKLLRRLDLTRGDVFYDLGSGIGKLTWQVAMATPVARSVGIELVPSRHRIAGVSRRRAKRIGWATAERVEFVRGDLLRQDLSDATVAYCCCTAFPDRMIERVVRKLAKCRPGLRFVSVTPLDDNPWFDCIDQLTLETTWSEAVKVRLYRLERPWGFTRRKRRAS